MKTPTGKKIMDLLYHLSDSADDTGCDGGLTVVSKTALNNVLAVNLCCPVCDGDTIHREGCPGILDPTLPATVGTRLKETADELERCWTALGQVKPNRHVTDARALLQAWRDVSTRGFNPWFNPKEPPTAAEVTESLAAKFRAAGFELDPTTATCQQLLDILKDVEFIYTTATDGKKQPFTIDTSRHFFDSVWQNCECETIARNIVLLAKRRGDWFAFTWDEYASLTDHQATFREHNSLDALVAGNYLKFEQDRYSVTQKFTDYLAAMYPATSR